MAFFAIPKLSPRLRFSATLLGATMLAGGALWSLARLDLGIGQINPKPLFINLLLVQPILLAIAAITLRLSALAVGTTFAFGDALKYVSYATLAEILPLPGGALVRGAAIVKSGASLAAATSIVTVTAILSLGLLIALSASSLIALGTPEAWPILTLALIALLVTFGMIARRAGIVLALAILGIRMATTAAGVVAIFLSLASIGQPSGVLEAALLTVSATLGSAVAIVPAGLGISEGIAAGLASLTSVPPAAAFLAVAIHRALGLLVSWVVVLVAGHRL